MSPARIGRPSDASISLDFSQSWISPAMRVASRTTGEDALVSSSGDHGSPRSTVSGFSVGQISISPAWPARCTACWIDLGRRRQARRAHGIGEDAVDRLQQRRHRAERQRQRNVAPRQLGAAGVLGERLADVGEHVRRRALEAVDRLLLVADRKQRARHLARAGAGEELLGQRAHHLPLHRAGILRLVDQDVVEAAVELVEHPFDRRRRAEQVRRPHDQVVEIERRAPRLGLGVALHDGVAEPEQRHRRVEQHQPAAARRAGRRSDPAPASAAARMSGCAAASGLVIIDLRGSPVEVRNASSRASMRRAAPAAP